MTTKFKYTIVATALAVASLTTYAGTTAGELIDLDAQTTKSTMEAALAKAKASASGAAAIGQQALPSDGNSAMTAATNVATSTPPATTAVYGLDGSAIGMKPSLRSLVRWNGIVYPAYKGGSIRGYKVTDVTIEGTTLVKGKDKIFAETDIDDGKAVESAVGPHKALAKGSPLPVSPVVQSTTSASAQQSPPVFLPVPMQSQQQAQAQIGTTAQ